MAMMTKIAFFFVMAFIIGCSVPPPNRHFQERLSEEAIVATFNMTTQTVNLLLGNKDHRELLNSTQVANCIILNKDHTFSVNAIEPGLMGMQAWKAKGTWELNYTANQSYGSGTQSINILHIVYNQGVVEVSADYFFALRDGKLTLWQYHEDPDNCEYIEYIKAN